MSAISRRHLLKNALTLAGTAALPALPFAHEPHKRRFKIGACDWSMGKSADIGAFELARQIGLQGIQVNLGSTADNLHLRQKSVQQQFFAESKRTGIKIASIAIGELNHIPYKSDPRTEEWVWDSIDVAKALDVKVVLFAFFAKNDLRNDASGKAEVVRRLKMVAPKAEKAGIILGLETYLSAAEHLDIMQRVGSPAVKIYYDFRNTVDAGHDIFQEIPLLCREKAICELHMKENGQLLGKGTLDWPRIQRALADAGYYGDGWMQIEWAKPDKEDVVACYRHNLEFLQKLFHS